MKVLKMSWEMLKFKPGLVFAGFLSDVLFFLQPLAASIIVMEIFNRLQEVPGWQIEVNLWVLVLLVLPLTLSMRLIGDFVFVFTMWIFVIMSRVLLRKNMLAGIFKKPGAVALPDSPGEAISRFRGDTEEFMWFTYHLTSFFSLGIFTGISFYMMSDINWKVTVFVGIPFVVMMIMVFFTRPIFTRLRKARRKAAGAVTRTIGEIFRSVQSIKVAIAEENVLNYFNEINRQRKDAEVKDEFFHQLLHSIYKIFNKVLQH